MKSAVFAILSVGWVSVAACAQTEAINFDGETDASSNTYSTTVTVPSEFEGTWVAEWDLRIRIVNNGNFTVEEPRTAGNIKCIYGTEGPVVDFSTVDSSTYTAPGIVNVTHSVIFRPIRWYYLIAEKSHTVCASDYLRRLMNPNFEQWMIGWAVVDKDTFVRDNGFIYTRQK